MNRQLIHHAVAIQAELRPEATALIHRGGSISYRELDATAERWAAELAGLGVDPGVVVPVWLPRSVQLVVSLLAILKCGAAYTALDHRWPQARVAAILAGIKPGVVVTRSGAPAPAGTQQWYPPVAVHSEPLAGPYRTPWADRDELLPASVFFTSGTTGAPKGVVSPHRATTRLFAPGCPLEFGPGRVMPQAAPAPWDAFSLELWGMLTTGGTSVLVEEDYLAPEVLEDLIDRVGIDTLWLTSSLFNLFVEDDLDCFSGLRQLFIGGERLSPPHVRRFLTGQPGIELFNGYGPVESCVFATVHRIRPVDCDAMHGIPIGQPVPATGVHIVVDGTEVPAGTEGELCISGDGLALGYLGDDALTRKKFGEIETDGTARRVYRTGDRGFVDADGTVHFTGRGDRQVKVRGHRIELEEIEAVAIQLPQVTRAAVVLIPDELGSFDRLALFFTTLSVPCGEPSQDGQGGHASAERSVRSALKDQLPTHAIPDLVRLLGRLPVTSNGKIDYAALVTAATR